MKVDTDLEINRLKKILNKCLDGADKIIDTIAVKIQEQANRDNKLGQEIWYLVELKHGPFNESRLKMATHLFRKLEDYELVSFIFKNLADCDAFRFNFKKCKFEKPLVLWA